MPYSRYLAKKFLPHKAEQSINQSMRKPSRPDTGCCTRWHQAKRRRSLCHKVWRRTNLWWRTPGLVGTWCTPFVWCWVQKFRRGRPKLGWWWGKTSQLGNQCRWWLWWPSIDQNHRWWVLSLWSRHKRNLPCNRCTRWLWWQSIDRKNRPQDWRWWWRRMTRPDSQCTPLRHQWHRYPCHSLDTRSLPSPG